MFCSRQGVSESIALWGSRIDTRQSELREVVYRICRGKEVISAMGLNNHLAKTCFMHLNTLFIYSVLILLAELFMLMKAVTRCAKT
jgi:hypothetical protein